MLMLPSPEALVAPPLQVSSTRPISGPSPPVCVARFAPALSEDSASLSLQKKKKKKREKIEVCFVVRWIYPESGILRRNKNQLKKRRSPRGICLAFYCLLF
jgi:hypothetical protein